MGKGDVQLIPSYTSQTSPDPLLTFKYRDWESALLRFQAPDSVLRMNFNVNRLSERERETQSFAYSTFDEHLASDTSYSWCFINCFIKIYHNLSYDENTWAYKKDLYHMGHTKFHEAICKPTSHEST